VWFLRLLYSSRVRSSWSPDSWGWGLRWLPLGGNALARSLGRRRATCGRAGARMALVGRLENGRLVIDRCYAHAYYADGRLGERSRRYAERGGCERRSMPVVVRVRDLARAWKPPDYGDSSARRDHQASAAVIALSAWWMSLPTSPAVAAQCKGTRARAPGSQRCSSGVSGSGAVPS
jgi:hypothetical protein